MKFEEERTSGEPMSHRVLREKLMVTQQV